MAGGGGGQRVTKGDQSTSGLAWGFQSVALNGEGLTSVYPVVYEGPGPPLRPLAQVGPVACAALVRSFGSLRPVALSRGASGGAGRCRTAGLLALCNASRIVRHSVCLVLCRMAVGCWQLCSTPNADVLHGTAFVVVERCACVCECHFM